MTFAFNGQAVVRHVNLRKEGATDAKHVAADIKLQAIADASILDPFNDHLVHLLFNPAGDPRIVNLEPIALEGSIKHLGCEFPDWGIVLNDAEAKKFTFEPMAGRRVTMTFSVAIEPRGQQTAKLAEMLGESVKVMIGVEGDLLAPSAADAAREMLAKQEKARASRKSAGEAMNELNELLARDGSTGEILDGKGNTLLTLTGAGEDAVLVTRAVALVRDLGRCSISLVQRHLSIGYNHAARIIEAMEAEGVVMRTQGGSRFEVVPRETIPEKTETKSPKSQPKTAKVQRKTAKPGESEQEGEKPAGKCWTAQELLARIPPAQGGHVLVLRAIAPAREEFIELRLNMLDDRGMRVQVGYECAGKGTGTFTAPTICRQRGMLEDAITDVLISIRERYKWKHLHEAVNGWPLSKAFRNIGCRTI